MGVPVEDGTEGFSDVIDRIGIVQLAGCHDGGEERPVFGADFVTGEQGVFSCQGVAT